MGIDTFYYAICNGLGECEYCFFVVITVTDTTATPPIAVDDFVTIDTTQTDTLIAVLDNDVDTVFANLVVGIVTLPLNGTTTVVGDTAILYTPNTGFVGDDSLTYVVINGAGLSDTATVFITVVPDNANRTSWLLRLMITLLPNKIPKLTYLY